MVLCQLVLVDAEDDREVGTVAGGGDQHALGAGGQMRRGLLPGREDAGAFQRDIDAQRLVRQILGIAYGGDLDRAAADIDRVAGDRHRAGEAAVDAVEAEEVRVGLDRAEIVDRHDLDVLALRLDDRAQHVAPDAAEAVDRHLHRHVFLSLAVRPA